MKVHLTTLGCPKNQVDSELMLGMLTEAGFPLAERPEDAECLVVNTCAFIDRAREESIDTILELAKLKKQGSCRALIVTGCLTQRYGGDILKEMPEVDGILGTSNLSRIVDLVRQAAGPPTTGRARRRPGYLYDATTPRLLTGRVPYAYVKIAEGCDMGCTFCAIPQFRGRHRSRSLADIVKEVEGLAARGHPGGDPRLSGHARVRPRHLPGNGDIADLLLALGETRDPVDPADVPASRARQRPAHRALGARAGRAVPRHAGPARRRRRAARHAPGDHRQAHAGDRPRVPRRDPGLTVRTTVLVGFPGESEAAFQNLLEFLEDARFDRLGVFTYSPEEGTPSVAYPDQVPAEIARPSAPRSCRSTRTAARGSRAPRSPAP